ncbi:MAG: DUF1080 domain-containing protein [Planctomycetota bacterium]
MRLPLSFLSTVLVLAATAWADHHAEPASGPAWVDLFDGESLAGWNKPFDWGEAYVEDGVICLKGDRKFFLVSDERYADFVFEAEIMLPPEGKANSGLMFRCHVQKNKVFGYQAECDPTARAWSGGLYDEARRAWLYPRKPDDVGKVKLVQAPRGEWLSYRIECVGDSLKIFVGGELQTELTDDVDSEGHFGLQHHGEDGQIYRFRNIRVAEL